MQYGCASFVDVKKTIFCSASMLAKCITVTKGPHSLVNSRALRVDESCKLESLLTEVCLTDAVRCKLVVIFSLCLTSLVICDEKL
jgi:hypothetical protein